LPLSTTVEKVPELVPPEFPKVTVKPPVMKGLPLVSLEVNVRVTPEPELTVDEETLTEDRERERLAGTTLMLAAVELSAEPLTVAVIEVAVPVVVAVNVEE
jgi:hypothetical protein